MSEPLQKILGVAPDYANYMPNDTLPSNTKVGVEVELENMPQREHVDLKYWRITGDGSLRDNGVELVMSNPTCGQTLIDAMEELDSFLQGFEPVASDRTSTHVHLDFRDSTIDQAFQFCMMYAIFEKTFFKYAGGVEREDSIYCIPLYKSYEAMTRVARLNERAIVKKWPKGNGSKLQREVQNAVDEWEKYSAMNIHPLSSFGSIEIRLHKGEVSSEKILQWVKILLTLKKFTDETVIDFEELFNQMSFSGCSGIMQDVFGANGTLEYFDGIEGIEEDLSHGLRVAQDIFNIFKVRHRSVTSIPKGLRFEGMDTEHPLASMEVTEKKDGKKRKKPSRPLKNPQVDPFAQFAVRNETEAERPVPVDPNVRGGRNAEAVGAAYGRGGRPVRFPGGQVPEPDWEQFRADPAIPRPQVQTERAEPIDIVIPPALPTREEVEELERLINDIQRDNNGENL